MPRAVAVVQGQSAPDVLVRMPPRVKKVDASWCGDVLRADEKRISYKAAKTGKGIYSLGQCIEVRKLTGPVEGIVLQLWESRKKGVEREKMVKVLEFTKEDGTMKNEVHCQSHNSNSDGESGNFC